MASSSKRFSTVEAIDLIIGSDHANQCNTPKVIQMTAVQSTSKATTSSKSADRFYGHRNKCTTLSEAIDAVEINETCVRSVTVLPPDGGNQVLTDEEEDFDCIDRLPEDVAGSLEIDFETDEERETVIERDEQVEASEATNKLSTKRKRKTILKTIDNSCSDDSNDDDWYVQNEKQQLATKKKKRQAVDELSTKEKGKTTTKKNSKNETSEVAKNSAKKETKKSKKGDTDAEYPWTKKRDVFKPLSRDGSVDGHAKISHLEGKTPFETWNLFFTEEMVNTITFQTMLYAGRDKGDHNFQVMSDEIYQILGVILLSGYHKIPKERDFWSTQPDLQVPFVSKEMTRNRYLKIKQYLHVADNQNLEAGNKVAKVQPLYDAFNKQLKQFGILHSLLSVDESMVPYKGLHSIRQYMKDKPVKFGYKLWALCGEDGFPYHLVIYCGASGEAHGRFGLGGNVVNMMVEEAKGMDEANVEFFFDNYFTSYQLIEHLAEQKILATGTVRENRTGGANLIMIDKKTMKKRERGNFDFACTKDVYIATWNDNSVVQVISNVHQTNPVHTVLRRVKGKGQVPVSQPRMIKNYNEGMGGVDQLDRLLQSYRPSIHMRKWWWALFVNLLNASVAAAWRFYRMANPEEKMTHLDFRRNIVMVLIKSKGEPRKSERAVANLPQEIRLDNDGHIVENTTQGRCRICKKNTCKRCAKCLVRLHSDRGKECWYMYHNNPEL